MAKDKNKDKKQKQDNPLSAITDKVFQGLNNYSKEDRRKIIYRLRAKSKKEFAPSDKKANKTNKK